MVLSACEYFLHFPTHTFVIFYSRKKTGVFSDEKRVSRQFPPILCMR
jgi:hypothetical protein